VEKEGLPFPVLSDPDRSIALAYGMSKEGDSQYLANPAEGRRPAVIIDEEGLVLNMLPDLATVEQQEETLASLA
jgi:peroxiredoxin